ncbi:MAG: NAD(P) transhydrogenase subunit alpha [Oligoflexales bacterium]
MKIAIPRETYPGEKRVAMVPSILKKLKNLDFEIGCEAQLGTDLGIEDHTYQESGANIYADRKNLLEEADIILRVRPTPIEEVKLLKPGSITIGFSEPDKESPLTEAFVKQKAASISFHKIPRTSIAQKMDALSSQSNLAGYAAVIMGAAQMKRILPMMTTPAGTIPAANVLVIGAGVAGLQAIATAKRLGARVDAYDTRPEAAEQVKSLGAQFVQLEIGKVEETNDGHTKSISENQLALQRKQLLVHLKKADLVITTAQIPGKKAPRIITSNMLEVMQYNSVLVDMAVETGGNIEESKPNELVSTHGVQILGLGNLPSQVADHASYLYSTNIYSA